VHELGRDKTKTTNELLDIAISHASRDEVAKVVFVQGDGKADPTSGRGAPPKAVGKGAQRSTKGSRRVPKRCPQWVIVTTSCDEDDNNSDKEHVAMAERSFKHQALQPVDHFEKILKATSQNHAYPIKDKLKEWSIMKNYKTIGALTKNKKIEGGPSGKVATPFPGEEAVMTIYGGPVPHES
jgi:hypothetical protein